jgi:hypothetical protein
MLATFLESFADMSKGNMLVTIVPWFANPSSEDARFVMLVCSVADVTGGRIVVILLESFSDAFEDNIPSILV